MSNESKFATKDSQRSKWSRGGGLRVVGGGRAVDHRGFFVNQRRVLASGDLIQKWRKMEKNNLANDKLENHKREAKEKTSQKKGRVKVR